MRLELDRGCRVDVHRVGFRFLRFRAHARLKSFHLLLFCFRLTSKGPVCKVLVRALVLYWLNEQPLTTYAWHMPGKAHYSSKPPNP